MSFGILLKGTSAVGWVQSFLPYWLHNLLLACFVLSYVNRTRPLRITPKTSDPITYSSGEYFRLLSPNTWQRCTTLTPCGRSVTLHSSHMHTIQHYINIKFQCNLLLMVCRFIPAWCCGAAVSVPGCVRSHTCSLSTTHYPGKSLQGTSQCRTDQ